MILKFKLKENALNFIKNKSEKIKDAEDIFLNGWFDTPNEEVEVEIVFKDSILNKTLKVKYSNTRGLYIKLFNVSLYSYDFKECD